MATVKQAVQKQLFDFPKDLNKAAFSDPAFAKNKTQPVHRWVPWIAGFSSEFVQSAIQRHLKQKGTVLDPFSGVGTTLVEAILSGHDAIGFEINPYAALACQTKLTAAKTPASVIKQSIDEFTSFYQKAISTGAKPKSTPPEGFKTRDEFYSPSVLHKVLLVQDFINSIDDEVLKNIFRLSFASTMVTYSNYSYEPSLGRRVSAGRDNILDFPVDEEIAKKLTDIANDIDWMDEKLGGTVPDSKVFNKSFFDSKGDIKSGSVDLLITSPPYLNNYHYNRNTRPHLYWLGFAEKPVDLKPLEEANYGKFWQTVRDQDFIGLDFECKDDEINQTLEELRTKNPEKGVYGGNGWANYAASYFNDCYKFAKCAKHSLKRRGTALVVIGNSVLQGVSIPTDKFLGSIAEIAGLQLVDIHIPRATRVGSSIIQSDVRVEKAKKSVKLYESVVELRKK